VIETVMADDCDARSTDESHERTRRGVLITVGAAALTGLAGCSGGGGDGGDSGGDGATPTDTLTDEPTPTETPMTGTATSTPTPTSSGTERTVTGLTPPDGSDPEGCPGTPFEYERVVVPTPTAGDSPASVAVPASLQREKVTYLSITVDAARLQIEAKVFEDSTVDAEMDKLRLPEVTDRYDLPQGSRATAGNGEPANVTVFVPLPDDGVVRVSVGSRGPSANCPRAMFAIHEHAINSIELA
jgi:hypothetical protein